MEEVATATLVLFRLSHPVMGCAAHLATHRQCGFGFPALFLPWRDPVWQPQPSV